MTNRLYIILFFQICFVFSYAQNWIDLDLGANAEIRNIFGDEKNNRLLVVGSFDSIGGIEAQRIASWDGMSWTSLCIPSTSFEYQPIVNIINYKDTLVVSGTQSIIGNNYTGYLAFNNGLNWNSFGYPNSPCSPIMIDSTELFCVGYQNQFQMNFTGNVSKWDGQNWVGFGDPTIWDTNPQNTDCVNEIVKYKSSYVIGGNFDRPNLSEIAEWDGTTWKPLQNGVLGNAEIESMAVFNDILYVGGMFDEGLNLNVANNFMAWNGNNWFKPFESINFEGICRDIKVYKNNLYLVGAFSFEGDEKIYNIGKFDGTNFCALGGSFTNTDFQLAKHITFVNDKIYLQTGKTYFGNVVNYIAQWNGTAMDTCIYSPITVSLNEKEKNELKLLPNPTQNTLQITFTSNQKINDDFIIYDQLGKIVFSQNFDINIGENKLEIDLSSLKQGVYYTSLKNNTNYATTKLVKL